MKGDIPIYFWLLLAMAVGFFIGAKMLPRQKPYVINIIAPADTVIDTQAEGNPHE